MTEANPEEGDLAANPLVGPLLRQSEAAEQATLNAILAEGIDEGWLLRPSPEQLITDSWMVDRLLREVEARATTVPTQEDPWRERMPIPPRALGSEPAWVLLSQRCDLIRCYALEPVIELAPARRITDKGEARKARLNSTRLIGIASDEDGLWAAELRLRAWLPKHLLVEIPRHPAIADPSEQKRLRHRLGARYWRDAVPDDIRSGVGIPMARAFSKGPRNRLLEDFSMLLGRREGGKILVLALIGPDADEDHARSSWDEALSELSEIDSSARDLLHAESGPIAEVDLSVAEWLDCFKFDFDDLSYGSKASPGQAPPQL